MSATERVVLAAGQGRAAGTAFATHATMATHQTDLDVQIAGAELAVIERDRRIRRQAGLLVGRAERGIKRLADPGLISGTAALLLAWWWPGRRHAVPHPAAAADGGRAAASNGWRGLPWATLLPSLWPLLPPPLRRRISPATAMLVGNIAGPAIAALWPARAAVQTMPEVDLARYAGRWYEIARLPAPFEGRCGSDATATYTARGQRIEVDNRCRGDDGSERRARGVAYPVEGASGAKLEVSLFPRWLRWLPFAWAGYWIIDLDPGYQTAVVGTPNRRGLWLLARTPDINDDTFQRMVASAAAQGYAVGRLQRIVHAA